MEVTPDGMKTFSPDIAVFASHNLVKGIEENIRKQCQPEWRTPGQETWGLHGDTGKNILDWKTQSSGDGPAPSVTWDKLPNLSLSLWLSVYEGGQRIVPVSPTSQSR